MRTILISNDTDLLSMIKTSGLDMNQQFKIYNESKDPLDVMSTVCEANPSLLIVDDDFLAPATVHVLKSIRKVNRSIDIIFCTSNTSIELGKEISQIGIQYYAIKPFTDDELHESIKAAKEAISKKKQSLIN
jgi:response regulator of citrate/malate metabolism